MAEPYLRPLHLAHNYHVLANRVPGLPGIVLRLNLFDDAGKEVAAVTVPDANANSWIRHRQSLLTLGFSDDARLQPPQSEVLPAPGKPVPKVRLWDIVDGRLKMLTVDVNQIPRDHPVSGPTDLMFVLARSYSRHLCREHGAAKANLVRQHQEPVRPVALTGDSISARIFDETTSEFGDYPK